MKKKIKTCKGWKVLLENRESISNWIHRNPYALWV